MFLKFQLGDLKGLCCTSFRLGFWKGDTRTWLIPEWSQVRIVVALSVCNISIWKYKPSVWIDDTKLEHIPSISPILMCLFPFQTPLAVSVGKYAVSLLPWCGWRYTWLFEEWRKRGWSWFRIRVPRLLSVSMEVLFPNRLFYFFLRFYCVQQKTKFLFGSQFIYSCTCYYCGMYI